ncbi:MAG: acyl-CoA dehydrogenase family protein [Janthinobacterium lividum]
MSFYLHPRARWKEQIANAVTMEVGLGGGSSIGCPPILNYGNEEQKKRFLPKVATGEIRFCLGITEPDGKFNQERSKSH